MTGKNYVQKAVIKAIKNDIAIYAFHTNLDNITGGVNTAMAERLGLIKESRRILSPKKEQLAKLYTTVPVPEAETVRKALFEAGAGSIGNYSECSFSVSGTGTFRPLANTNPAKGRRPAPAEPPPAEQPSEVACPLDAVKFLRGGKPLPSAVDPTTLAALALGRVAQDRTDLKPQNPGGKPGLAHATPIQ